MTIASDMCSALSALARLRAALAQDPAIRSHVAALGACLDALEDCRERAAELERAAMPPPIRVAIPAHHLPQRAAGPADGVISLDAARAQRAAMREVRL